MDQFKKKQTVKDILLNPAYNFIEGEDYEIVKYKPSTGRPGDDIRMTIDTVKSICLLSQTKKGHQFRQYYIKMEKLFMKYVSTDIKNKLTNPIPELNKYTFNIQDYIDKEVLYLIHVKDNIYKFGITYDINHRCSTKPLNILSNSYLGSTSS